MLKIVSLAIAATALGLTSVSAAESAATPMELCKGRLEIFRISKITPKGTMAGFLKAVADHEAWFKAHGYTKDIFGVARVIGIDRDAAKKTVSFSETEVITAHINPTQVPADKEDEAYKAFVKEYRDNSEITTEKFLCSPAAGK